jgi:hypothetical protein
MYNWWNFYGFKSGALIDAKEIFVNSWKQFLEFFMVSKQIQFINTVCVALHQQGFANLCVLVRFFAINSLLYYFKDWPDVFIDWCTQYIDHQFSEPATQSPPLPLHLIFCFSFYNFSRNFFQFLFLNLIFFWKLIKRLNLCNAFQLFLYIFVAQQTVAYHSHMTCLIQVFSNVLDWFDKYNTG